jgi:CelD/BcsL family acetyltransferase involved in cellulose biosynthesis
VRNDIEVAIIERNYEPVAFLPFRRMPWNGGRPVAGWLTNFQGIIAADDFDVDPAALMRSCELHSWQFDQLLRPPACLSQYVWRSWDSPYADLSNGYEGYCHRYCHRVRMDRKHLAEFGRLQRKMSREIGNVRFEAHVNDQVVLNTLFEWKGAQYKRTRERNIFAASWVRDLLNLLLDDRDKALSSLLSVLYAGDRIAAISFALRTGPNLHGWFTAFDRELSAYSPGSQLLLELFRAAESLGIRRIDLGKGPEAYKRRFMTDTVPVYEGAIDANPVVSSVRRRWWHTKDWVRKSQLATAARTSARLSRGIYGWLEMG